MMEDEREELAGKNDVVSAGEGCGKHSRIEGHNLALNIFFLSRFWTLGRDDVSESDAIPPPYWVRMPVCLQSCHKVYNACTCACARDLSHHKTLVKTNPHRLFWR